ncbi:MAG: hypothetical protein KF828_04865, partial [Anaerolineales bacterium]|nr:hypothetical protein [Anaerolineales bacterium]
QQRLKLLRNFPETAVFTAVFGLTVHLVGYVAAQRLKLLRKFPETAAFTAVFGLTTRLAHSAAAQRTSLPTTWQASCIWEPNPVQSSLTAYA